jgi:hypothetical protein
VAVLYGIRGERIAGGERIGGDLRLLSLPRLQQLERLREQVRGAPASQDMLGTRKERTTSSPKMEGTPIVPATVRAGS